MSEFSRVTAGAELGHVEAPRAPRRARTRAQISPNLSPSSKKHPKKNPLWGLWDLKNEELGQNSLVLRRVYVTEMWLGFGAASNAEMKKEIPIKKEMNVFYKGGVLQRG